MDFKPIKFPEDEFPHQNIIEWWYFNGHLKDESGNQYAYMTCLFKADPKKVKIPFFSKIPFKFVYFAHSLISDISQKKFYSDISPLVMVSKDSFTKDLFFVNYTYPSWSGYFNYVIEKNTPDDFHLKTQYFSLNLKNKKSPLLENEFGFLNMAENSTFYYSLTNLATAGDIIIDGKRIKVTGKSWMDHQWADAVYSGFKWTWFSLQLNNDTEIVCFSFENKSKQKTNLASLIDESGRQSSYQEVNFNQIGDIWQSPETKALYPLDWQIEIPAAGIKLTVKPLVREQEMIFGVINYWEGGLTVEGTIAQEKVNGQGFMELVGYPVKGSRINLYRKNLKRRLKLNIKKVISK